MKHGPFHYFLFVFLGLVLLAPSTAWSKEAFYSIPVGGYVKKVGARRIQVQFFHRDLTRIVPKAYIRQALAGQEVIRAGRGNIIVRPDRLGLVGDTDGVVIARPASNGPNIPSSVYRLVLSRQTALSLVR